MNYQTRFEIHFHDENKASALIKSSAEGSEKDFCEILIFCYLASRQMHNLRPNRVSTSLAEILSIMYSGAGDYTDYWELMTKLKSEEDIPYYVPFIAALGINVSKLVGLIPSLGIYRAVNKLSNEQIAKQICPTVAQVGNYNGIDAKKQFGADMEVWDRKVTRTHLKNG